MAAVAETADEPERGGVEAGALPVHAHLHLRQDEDDAQVYRESGRVTRPRGGPEGRSGRGVRSQGRTVLPNSPPAIIVEKSM
jgi:hypothetical protein